MRHSGKRHRDTGCDQWPDQIVEETERARCIHGFAMVSAGSVFSGSLTPWPAEAWSAYQWHGKPQDAFTLHVQAIFQLHEPLLTYDVESAEGVVTENPRFRQPLFIPHLQSAGDLLGHAGACEASVAGVCRQWSGCPEDDAAEVLRGLPAIALKPVQAEQIMAGASSTLFCLVRWCRFFLSVFVAKLSFPPTQWALQHLEDAKHWGVRQEASGFLQQVRCMWQSYVAGLAEEAPQDSCLHVNQ